MPIELLRRVAAPTFRRGFQGRCPWLHYHRTFGAQLNDHRSQRSTINDQRSTINEPRTTNHELNQHRISLVLRIVPDTYFRTRCVPERIATLLVVEKLGRFEVDAIECIQIKNDLVTATVRFGVDDATVCDAPVGHEMRPAFGEDIPLLLAFEQTKNSHRLINYKRRLAVSRPELINGRKN